MPKSQRTLARQAARKERQHRIAALYCEGYSLREISKLVAVTFQMVSKDLHVVREEWAARNAEAYQARVARELAKLDHAEHEAWLAWEESKKPEHQHADETERGTGGNVTKTRASTKRTNRLPEARFHDQVLRCIDMRLRLLGAYELAKPAPPPDSKPGEAVTDSELENIAADMTPAERELVRQLRARLATRRLVIQGSAADAGSGDSV